MKLSERHEWDLGCIGVLDDVCDLEKNVTSARAIMQKFVDKVDSGLARSTETYAEMKQWMEDE